jgi:hypothetical protein
MEKEKKKCMNVAPREKVDILKDGNVRETRYLLGGPGSPGHPKLVNVDLN